MKFRKCPCCGHRVEAPFRHCDQCDKKFYRREDRSGCRERYCSDKCRKKAKNINALRWWHRVGDANRRKRTAK